MKLKFIILLLLLVIFFATDVLLGSITIEPSEIFVHGSITNTLLFNFRIPKATTALVAGAALSASGLMMQTIFRNPLAGPHILGVSSGASLGVALFMLGSPLLGLGYIRELGIAFSAWVGAATVLLVVMTVSARLKNIMTVLILGMMFGSATSAFVDVLQYFSNDTALKGFVIWAMGSLGGVSTPQLAILAGSTIVGLLLAIWAVKPLNLLLLGENYARTMGLNVRLTRTIIFSSTALLAGGVTAFCGPIAFIGIAVPHIARMIFREANHRILLPASVLTGMVLMLACDIIASLPGSNTVLPINTITSLIGIPVVVMILWRGNR